MCNTFYVDMLNFVVTLTNKIEEMKKAMYNIIFLAMIAGTVFTSCVSSKKFKASEAEIAQLQKENATVHEQYAKCNSWANDLASKNLILTNQNEIVELDLKDLAAESSSTIADQAKRLRGLNNIITVQKTAMNNLRKTVSDALIGYNTDELRIEEKNGNIYVLMEEKLLFKSGSDVVDKKGKEALKTLAKVLNSTSDINVMVEGHTDNIAISTGQFKDNWDLSVARATAIVRIVSQEYGFNPNRITASGKGKYNPVQTNETEEGRASNRRIEVILTPNLKELFEMLYQ
jgi:chemotaxis protein MotB